MKIISSILYRKLFLLLSLFTFHSIFLKGEYYDSIYLKIEENEGFPQQKIYLEAYLSRAKEEKNFPELINAYRYYSFYSSKIHEFAYADSMVWAAKLSKDSILIAEANLSKGILYYKYKRYESSLHFYLKAHEYLAAKQNEYLYYKLRYNIAQVKSYLGNYEEAIDLYTECMNYFRNENPRAYINSLHALALCHSRQGDFSRSDQFIETGLKELNQELIFDMEAYFTQLKGINSSFNSDFYSAIKLIESSLPPIKEKGDFANLAQSYFHLGKSYWALNYKCKAVYNFKKVDEIFSRHNYIHPKLREAYWYLYQHYRSVENFDSADYFMNQNIKAHWQYEKEFLVLNPVLFQGYDQSLTKNEILNLKKSLTSAKRTNKFLLFAIVGMVLFFLVLGYRNLKAIDKKKKIKRKLENSSQELNPQRLEILCTQLEKFESSKKFLKKDWSQAQLAAEFGSNVAYLKEAIRQFKGKNFSNYINDLRIDHLLELLKTEKKLRYYDNKALAQEVGFSTTSRFTKAFKSRTGQNPGDYLHLMRER